MSRRGPLEPSKRQLPHHVEAEAGVLGGIILKNEALVEVPDLETEDFYDSRHRVVFSAVRNLEAIGMPIDVVTLENEITKAGKLDAIGGVAFLGELCLRVPTIDNVEIYGKIIRTKRTTRDVMVALGQLLDEAYLGEVEGDQLVHDVTSAMMLIGSHGEDPMVMVADLIAEEAARVDADMKRRAAGELVYAGVPTGVDRIDTMVGGHPIGIPTIYAARPGTAKTTIAMMFAKSSRELTLPARRELGEGDSAIFSYEDAGQTFGQRGLAQESGLATELLRARKLTPDDLVTMAAASLASQGRRELFKSAAGMRVESLVRYVRRENVRRKSRGLAPLAQILVDYIQKMPMPEHCRSRDEGIGHISQCLAAMAVQESCALVEFCQLNRDVEKRDDHEPRLEDLRESGNLEQDGKFIVGVHYPYKYDPRKFSRTELHLLILKNHNGAPGIDITMFWDVLTHAIYNTELEWQDARQGRLRARLAAERARR